MVCTGNICRSPVGEAVLRQSLPDRFRISSAGTQAVVGAPAAPEAVRFVRQEVDVALDHVGRQLSTEQVEDADLVLTMTLEQRAWVARLSPRAVRRTFTLRELALVLGHPGLTASRGTLRDLALEASMFRFQAGVEAAELDIEDPYGRSPRDYEQAFREVLVAGRMIAGVLEGRVAGERAGAPGPTRKVIPFRASGGPTSGTLPP